MIAWISLAIAAGYQEAADNQRLLSIALDQSLVSFAATYRSTVKTKNSKVETEVHVHSDGRGTMRRTYTSGPLIGTTMVLTDSSGWLKKGSEPWTRTSLGRLYRGSVAADLVRKNYIVKYSDRKPSGGHRFIEVSIEAKQKFQQPRYMTIDKNSGVVYRDSSIGNGYTTIQELVSLDGPNKEDLSLPNGDLVQSLQFGPLSFQGGSKQTVVRSTNQAIPVPQYLPPGFVPVAYGMIRTGSSRLMPAVHYSEGLVSFTIFRTGRGRGFGAQSNRAMPSQSAFVHEFRPGYGYIVTGELPKVELEKIAKSLP